MIQLFSFSILSLYLIEVLIINSVIVNNFTHIFFVRECEIKGIHAFGVFVEILPGYEGLVHVSELDLKKVNTYRTDFLSFVSS